MDDARCATFVRRGRRCRGRSSYDPWRCADSGCDRIRPTCRAGSASAAPVDDGGAGVRVVVEDGRGCARGHAACRDPAIAARARDACGGRHSGPANADPRELEAHCARSAQSRCRSGQGPWMQLRGCVVRPESPVAAGARRLRRRRDAATSDCRGSRRASSAEGAARSAIGARASTRRGSTPQGGDACSIQHD